MLKVSNWVVYDLKPSIIACRNAMRTAPAELTDAEFEKSLERAVKLAHSPSGSGEQTFLSGIRVSFDVMYPQYWTPQFQRYHFADIVSSSSKMHRLLSMDIDSACNKYVSSSVIEQLRFDISVWNGINDTEWIDGTRMPFTLRDGTTVVAETKADALYYAFMRCISDCPCGLELFMRVSTNYLQLKGMYRQRRHHKLREDWGALCDWIETLPYARELICD